MMIREVAILNVIPGLEDEFEAAFKQASAIISGMLGYGSHQIRRCREHRNRYILLVEGQRSKTTPSDSEEDQQLAQL